jgi:hypothetical protein
VGRARIGIEKKRPANAQVRSSLIAVKEQACKHAPSQFGARADLNIYLNSHWRH